MKHWFFWAIFFIVLGFVAGALIGGRSPYIQEIVQSAHSIDTGKLKEKLPDIGAQKLKEKLSRVDVEKTTEKLADASGIFDLDTCSVIVRFSPNGGCENMVIKVIKNAKKTLDISVYTFTSRPIAQALVDAENRGVYVRVITDYTSSRQRYSKAEYLSRQEIPVKTNGTGSYIMHNKFCVADTAIVLTGSFNWTRSAENKNRENIVVLKSKQLAKRYERDFSRMWSIYPAYR